MLERWAVPRTGRTRSATADSERLGGAATGALEGRQPPSAPRAWLVPVAALPGRHREGAAAERLAPSVLTVRLAIGRERGRRSPRHSAPRIDPGRAETPAARHPVSPAPPPERAGEGAGAPRRSLWVVR